MPIDILTPLKRKITIYSDFTKNLDINPISTDLTLKLDEESVKESIRTLVLTGKGERLFQPNLGSDIRKSLFDLMTPATIKIAEESIKATITNHEPRASIISIQVIPLYDKNALNIIVQFFVRNSQAPVSISLFLERTR